MSKPDPLDQLAAFRIDVDDERRGRDLAAIRTELERRPPNPRRVRRRWTLSVVVALMLAGPAAAVAGDTAVPGDLLYPVKRIAEPIVQLFDRDIVAEHRVEEVAALIDRGSEDALIEDRIAVARLAVAETDAPVLAQRLDRIVDRWVSDRIEISPPATDVAPVTTDTSAPTGDMTDPPRDSRSTDPTTTSTSGDRPRDTPPPERATTTTSAAPTTSTATDSETPPADGDRPRDRP